MTWPVNTARAGAARDDIFLKESENAFGKNNYSLTSVQLLCPHTSALHLSPSQLVCWTVGAMCNVQYISYCFWILLDKMNFYAYLILVVVDGEYVILQFIVPPCTVQAAA